MSILPPPGYGYPKEFRKMDKIIDLIYIGTLLMVVLGFVITLIAISL